MLTLTIISFIPLLTHFLVFFLLYFPSPVLLSLLIVNDSPQLTATLLPSFGIDRLTILFLLLTTFLMPIVVCVLLSSTSPTTHSSILLSSVAFAPLVFSFLSLSLLIFFFFFEFILVFSYVCVSRFGSKLYCVRSSVYLLLYSLFGAVFLLSGIILLLLITGTTNVFMLQQVLFVNRYHSLSIAILVTVGFGVKVPIFPLHYWLPEVHIESSTAVSVILAGILLKLGIYGLIRFDFTHFPFGTAFWSSFLFSLSLSGCLIASCNALLSNDIKTTLAFSSISHMNFSIAALFTLNICGLIGCVITSVAHGLSSSCGFIVAGFVYDRTQSRSLLSLKGLFQIKDFPVLSLIFFLFILANMSFPGSMNGIGELLNVSALADSVSGFITVLAFVHICLAAAFCLFL